jgi:hypothetical protein
MAIETVAVGNSLVFRDVDKPWRWFDAIGPDVSKTIINPMQNGIATTTSYAGAVTTVATSGTLVTEQSEDGGAITLVPAAADNQGIQIQFGEGFSFASKWPCYFGARFKNVDVTQSDWLIGLAIWDTTLLDDTTDGIFFRTVDASAALSFVLEKNTNETLAAVATLVDATYVDAEWYYDGTNVTAYINGVEVASVAGTNANFCNDEHLALSLALLSGEATSNILSVAWARAIQVRTT